MRARLLLPSLAISLLALAGSIAPVGAFVTVGQGGTIGSFSWSDTEGNTAASCYYDENVPGAQGSDIDRIRIDHPVVFAKAGTRKVGWRYLVQRSEDAGGTGGWTTIKKSDLQKRTATTTSPAAFSDRYYTIPTNVDHHFRVLIVIQWYEAGSSTEVDGFRKLRAEHYRALNNGSLRVDIDRCLPEY
jgi:hypothetical protein